MCILYANQMSTSLSQQHQQNNLNQNIEQVTIGLLPNYRRHLNNVAAINATNATAICDYVNAMKSEVNPADHYRKDTIELLTRLARKSGDRTFKELTQEDIVAFLDTLRKSDELDPLHKWIGTYNLFRMQLFRFFKWLYSPDMNYKNRPKPNVIENIAQLRRKEKSIYKPSDLWTPADDLIFLKYCPSKRDKCYHAVSRDLSCRPHELLKLKRKDLSFKMIGSNQYAEVVVNGKTGTRPIPIINSLPYVKDYLTNEHPVPSNPNSPLICGIGKALGRHITTKALHRTYANYKKVIFPRLLQSPDVIPEDKPAIEELLKKPWNPYIRRHSALTEKSMILKENVLRQHAGWTQGSQMHLKYLHYFGNESSESLLEAYGLVDHGVHMDQLKPKQWRHLH
jgi:integrase